MLLVTPRSSAPSRARWRRGLVWSLLSVVAVAGGCAGTTNTKAVSEGAGEDGADDAVLDDGAGGGGASEDTGLADPWPGEEELTGPGLSLVYDGRVLGPGDVLRVQTSPAGVDQPEVLWFTLTNRAASARTLPTEPSAWLSGEGFVWDTGPAAHLEPEASTRFALRLEPASVGEATEWEATLRVPGEEFAVDLRASVPRPLRAVVLTDGPAVLVSDDGGRSWSEHALPEEATRSATAIAWGGGRFLMAWRDGLDWSDPGRYAWSDDGLSWSESAVSDDFWASDCAWLDGFRCAREDALTWSASGETVIHEATAWEGLLNSVDTDGTRLVAVGRDGRRVWSLDGRGWSGGTPFAEGDDLHRVAQAGGTWVAVGGSDRYLVTVSRDGGESWTSTAWGEGRYATLWGVAHAGHSWLITGQSNTEAEVWRSLDDGETWHEAVDDGVHVLGSVNGAFIGVRQPWSAAGTLLWSTDGVVWTDAHTLSTTVAVRDLATEGLPR